MAIKEKEFIKKLKEEICDKLIASNQKKKKHTNLIGGFIVTLLGVSNLK